MVLFAVAVFVSFVFLIGNGALDWGPLKRIAPVAGLPESMRSAGRTAETTVKRVDVGRHEPAA
jgi:NADH-quinone oxidoreductase subunit A